MLSNIDHPKLRDVVIARLKSFIREEKLVPGDRLPTETDLAAKFGVSRLSLREATKSLEFLGIIEAKPGRGLTVGKVDLDRLTEHLGFHSALLDVEPSVLIDTRVVVETGVVPYLAEKMKQDDTIYSRLNDLNADMRITTELPRFMELDIAFHRELIRGSGLTPLIAFSDLITVFFRRFRESVKLAEWSEGTASHQAIIDALREGHLSEATRLVRLHIESHRPRINLAT